MRVSIVTIAYNLPASTEKLIKTAKSENNEVIFHLFLHSKDPDTVQMCESLKTQYGDRLLYYPYGENRGLSKSWNEGILNSASYESDVIMVVNDDIHFSEGDIDKIVAKSVSCRDNYIISVAGFHTRENEWRPSHGYSCFAINPIAIEKVGMFDENIFPIYLEDCDHHYRATLAGLVEGNCDDTKVFHGGSSAIHKDPDLNRQNGLTHMMSSQYYRRKWGGINGQETFTTPFNNPSFTYYISPENRHKPYGPPHDRIDHGIVRL